MYVQYIYIYVYICIHMYIYIYIYIYTYRPARASPAPPGRLRRRIYTTIVYHYMFVYQTLLYIKYNVRPVHLFRVFLLRVLE